METTCLADNEFQFLSLLKTLGKTHEAVDYVCKAMATD